MWPAYFPTLAGSGLLFLPFPMQTLQTFAPSVTADYPADAVIAAAIERFFITKKGGPAHLLGRAVLVGCDRAPAAFVASSQRVNNGWRLSAARGL
ncbi:hypothetical protein A0257_21660 [Hymenobacter psoromatis]|nr:hypothetical protein A0257_21660 [Hymenobacter psoromatis]